MSDSYRNLNQFKIDPLSEIRNAGIVTNGHVLWVKPTTDSDYTTLGDQVGYDSIRPTLNNVVDQAMTVTDRNDYILVTPPASNAPYTLTEGVNVAKNRLHIVGVGYNPTEYGKVTLRGFATAAPDTVDTELMAVTGAGVELRGITLLGTANTSSRGTINNGVLNLGTASTGTPHGFYAKNVTVESTSAAADNGTADIVVIEGNVSTGIQGIRFDDSWLGNWSWAPTNGIVSMSGTAGPTRTEFRNTTFVIDAQATTDKFVTMGTGALQYTLFENCKFINVEAATAPASALTGALLVDNPVLMHDNMYLNVTEAGTDTEVFKAPVASGTSAVIRDYGIAVGTSALIPV